MKRDVKVNHINSFQDDKVDSAGDEPQSKDKNGETIVTQPLHTKDVEESRGTSTELKPNVHQD